MTVLEVFDPAMCCSTGVCGPAPDPVLPAFAADLDWIGEHGVEVRRFNLSQEPGEFVQRPAVQHLLTRDGDDALPIVMLGDTVLSSGRYPSRTELAGWAGLAEAAPAVVWNAAVAELVALGAAVGANCEPCFEFHRDKARELGVADDDLVAAVRLAQGVKDTASEAMLDLAAKVFRVDPAALGSPLVAAAAEDPGESCCGGGPEPVALTSQPGASGAAGASSGCCG